MKPNVAPIFSTSTVIFLLVKKQSVGGKIHGKDDVRQKAHFDRGCDSKAEVEGPSKSPRESPPPSPKEDQPQPPPMGEQPQPGRESYAPRTSLIYLS
jgi:hypothetical protein